MTSGSQRLRFRGDVGVVDVQVDRLLVLGGGVPVGQQGRIRADPGREAAELQREVEPPSGVSLPEEDHQQGRREKGTADARTGPVDLGDDLTGGVDDRHR